MFGRSSRRTERLFEEGDADTLGAPHCFQGSRRPRLALHHLRKQSQPDTDDLAFLSQTVNGLFKKLFLLLAGLGTRVRQDAEGPPKGRQDFLGVADGEEIDSRRVLTIQKA